MIKNQLKIFLIGIGKVGPGPKKKKKNRKEERKGKTPVTILVCKY